MKIGLLIINNPIHGEGQEYVELFLEDLVFSQAINF